MSKLRLVFALAASAALAPMAAAQTVIDPDPYAAPPMAMAGARGSAQTPAPAPAARAPMAPAPRTSHWGPRGSAAAPPVQGAPAGPAYAARPPMARPPMATPGRPPMAQPGTQPGYRQSAPVPGGQAYARESRGGQAGHGQFHAGQSHAGQSHAGQSHAGQSHAGQFQGRQFRGSKMRGGQYHGGQWTHVQRVHRGGFVPQFWWGPQFVVRNWGGYGFPQPFAGGRWIRYYDDALLIDRDGRVHDERADWDWDREGDRWSHDDNGVPVYVGDGDFEPGRWDYEWAERWDRGEADDEEYVDRGPPPPAYGHGGYAQGGYAGYAQGGYAGYGYVPCACGPVVVTETTVTTPAVVEQVTYYDYVEERVARPAAKVRSKRVKVQRVPVAPYGGEKG